MHELAVAVATTQLDGFRRLLDTTDLNLEQWAWALIPTLALFVLWELGKLVVRRFRPATGRDG
jgi:Ca2+-transporting ATPase